MMRKTPPMIATQIASLIAARITTTVAVVREPHTYPPVGVALGREAAGARSIVPSSSTRSSGPRS